MIETNTDKFIAMIMSYGPKLVLAIVTLIVGLWVIKLIVKLIIASMKKANLEEALIHFLSSLLGMLLKIALVISVASMIGIEMTSFIAIVGAAGLAVGLALQGSLANFAGGVLILLFKPFKIGDFIEANGYMGTVREIQIINTILKTPDNKTIIIPNGSLSSACVTNFSTEPTRRVDMVFGIGYSDDIGKAKGILEKLFKGDSRVLQDPATMIIVSELADSSVNITVRAWCNSADYWGIFFDMQENVKLEFDKQGISIPFPQRDVHLFNQNG